MKKGQLGKSKYKDHFYAGQEMGSYTIITGEILPPGPKKFPHIAVKCDCGTERTVDIYWLLRSKNPSCIHCTAAKKSGPKNTQWHGYEEIPGKLLSSISRGARFRELTFQIMARDIWEQYLKQNRCCSLTGLPVFFRTEKCPGKAWSKASVDRIDSTKGYTPDNIQIVLSEINHMKNKYPQEVFIIMCRLVALKHKQPPLSECTKKEFEEMAVSLRNIDLTKVVEEVDNTDLKGEVSCGGKDSCEITRI